MRIISMKRTDLCILLVIDNREIQSARNVIFSVFPRRSGVDHQVIGTELQNFKFKGVGRSQGISILLNFI